MSLLRFCEWLASTPGSIALHESRYMFLIVLTVHVLTLMVFVGTAVMINKETKEMAPVPEFLHIPNLVEDMKHITDTNRGKWVSNALMGLALLKNYNPYGSPDSLTLGGIPGVRWRKPCGVSSARPP